MVSQPYVDLGSVERSSYVDRSDQARSHVIEMLDVLRRQREAYQVGQFFWMARARDCGMTFAEIAEHIGMSASGVRYVVAFTEGGGHP